MDNENYEIIDGIKCYSPEHAIENKNFQTEGFDILYKVEENNFWFRSRNNIITHLFKKHLGTDKIKDILEIGCGTGFVLKGLSQFKNYNLTGGEIYLEGLKFARKRLNDVDFIQLDASKMPFTDKYDAVGAFDVLEHIDDDELVIENVFKSLKDGGKFFLSVPQYMFMWSLADEIAYHKRRYSKKELLKKVSNAGFEIEYVGSFVTILFPLMYVSRMMQKSTNDKDKIEVTDYHEFEISDSVNKIFEKFMKIDEMFIKSGISLPFGGSLILVAGKKK